MSQVTARTAARRSIPMRDVWARLTRLNSVGTVSSPGTWYGAMWSGVIAVDFFLISSPLVFEPVFAESLKGACIFTTVACALALPRLRVPRAPWSLVLFLTFGTASSLWSINADLTIHFVGVYVMLAVLGIVVSSNVDVRVLSHGLMLGAVIVVFTSVYAYWRGMPGADVPPGSSGFLAGVGTNRNILAYCMILAFAFAVSFVPHRWSSRVCWLIGLLIILSGIVLAESATGIAASSALVATAMVLGSRDRLVSLGRPPGWRYRTALWGILLTLGAISVAWYEALHRELTRDLSLTGRVQIWESAWASSPALTRLIGDGWGTVWPHPWLPAPSNGPYYQIVQHIGHGVAHGHNSAMDLIPEVGLAGVALFALIYLQSVVPAFRRRRRSSDPGAREAGRVVILGVLGLLIAGVTEPISVIPVGFFVAVLLVAHVSAQVVAPSASTAPVHD